MRPAIAIAVLAIVAVDSVYPFQSAYAGSVAQGGEATRAARTYAAQVNTAIPDDCGVLQLPYMAYPEHGNQRDINDYDHFWTSITNDGKSWSYGSVKFTDASTWAAQLPQSPTDAQVALLRALAGDGRDLVAVGDPHQSIYAFRGATIRNIDEFERDFRSPHDIVMGVRLV